MAGLYSQDNIQNMRYKTRESIMITYNKLLILTRL